MNAEIVEEAIRKAIKGGAVQAPPIDGPEPDSDFNPFRAQTDVGFPDQQALADYVADLSRDPVMARFDSAYVSLGLGGSIRTNLASIARLLLARAIASGDVRGTVEACEADAAIPGN